MGGERDREEERRMESERERPVGCRNKVELDFHMDKFIQGFRNKAAIRAIESIT